MEHYKQVEEAPSSKVRSIMRPSRSVASTNSSKVQGNGRLVGHYLEKYGISGDYTQAIYRKGFAQQAQGKSKEALDTYWQAIEKYGNDPKAMGIDIIIDAYCEESRALNGSQPLDVIRAAALTASEQKERTRALRLARALAQRDAPGVPSAFIAADIRGASPAVLLWMAQAAAKTDPALAESAARAAIDKFGPTQWTGEAFLRLGDFAFEGETGNRRKPDSTKPSETLQ